MLPDRLIRKRSLVHHVIPEGVQISAASELRELIRVFFRILAEGWRPGQSAGRTEIRYRVSDTIPSVSIMRPATDPTQRCQRRRSLTTSAKGILGGTTYPNIAPYMATLQPSPSNSPRFFMSHHPGPRASPTIITRPSLLLIIIKR